jgi:hypothetical protein
MTITIYGHDPLWRLSSSSARDALDVVDGRGAWEGHGAHYSRRTRDSKTFTGVGQEIVLVRDDAVWAVVRNRLPAPRGSGASRGREGITAPTRYMWRCNMFRNLGPIQSSTLIRAAVATTVLHWLARYGELPDEDLTTEVKPDAIASEIAGYCYRRAGWVKVRERRGLVMLRCPRAQILRCVP